LIRFLFLSLAVASIIASIGFAHWESRLLRGNETFILDLPASAIWMSPRVPEYSEFEAMFNELPETQPANSTIGNRVRWDSVFLSFAVCVAGIGFIAAPVALFLKNRDNIIYYWTCTAIGLIGGFVSSFLLWIVIGGWGPPFPVFFAVVGLVGGFGIGALTQRRNAT
jgi:hypothetical protein